MPKINVYLPDELAEAVKEAGVPVSAVCQRALEQAVRRITAIRETGLSAPDLDGGSARFANFAPRARTAITLAAEQARAAKTAEVGTEHLLSGMLAEGSNLALQILRAMEIDPEQVRYELARLAPRETVAADDAALRFSESAAGALELTVTDAIAMGHNYVGCEHLLLGLIAEPSGVAGHVLRSLGADPRLTRRAVTAALAGYVHLRAQDQAARASESGDPAESLSAAIHRELRPIVRRLEQLEERLERVAGEE
ncbi:Clp protease N-terminal domain-containing protein [Streptosporangium sp. NPDC051022]|uniref:Clp protease N-terminal domain-containing protein n=1 Tax=Streptosporangium sp. NPDC051022 TaxID=3155752 RepID=UPI0034440567